MAASKVNKPVTDEIDEQILTCIVCLERYKNAKILPCHHSFCEECLEELVSKQGALNCPICRRPCPIPPGGVAKLPPSILVNGIIEIITAQTQSYQSSECEVCQEGVPINRCIDCSFYVCRNCTNTHVRIPATRHHRIMTLDEYERAIGDNAALAQPSVACKNHPENKVDFFCDTCEKPICMACAVVKHRGHEHREIKEAAESIRRSLEDKLKKLQVKATEVTQNLVQFKTKTQELDETYQREVNIVKKHTLETEQNIARMIREQEGKVLQDLKASYEQSKARMETKGTTLTQMKQGAETTGVFVQSLIRYGSDIQLVSTAAETSANLDEVLDTAVPFVQDVNTLPCFSQTPLEVSGSLGKLYSHDAVHAIIPEDIAEEDTVKITINSNCNITINSLKAEIIKRDTGERKQIPIQKPGTDHASDVLGVFSLTFDRAAVFDLFVTLNGKSIKGSPYLISVTKNWCRHSVFGSAGGGHCQFNGCWSVKVDSTGHVIVADMENHRVHVFDSQMTFKKFLKFIFRGKKPFCPSDIAVSREDIYYVLDGGVYNYDTGKCSLGGNNQIVVTNINGELTDVLGQGIFGDPSGLCLGLDQKVLFVVDSLRNCIYAFSLTPKFQQQMKVGRRGNGPGAFKNPDNIAITSEGNLIVSDSGNNRVQVLTANGKFLHHLRQGGILMGNLSCPYGIATDKADNIYVCDHSYGRVVKYDKKGNFSYEIHDLLGPVNLCFVDGPPYKMIVAERYRLVIFTKT